MAILQVKNLTKKFGPPAGGFTAVDNISFDLKEGEIIQFERQFFARLDDKKKMLFVYAHD